MQAARHQGRPVPIDREAHRRRPCSIASLPGSSLGVDTTSKLITHWSASHYGLLDGGPPPALEARLGLRGRDGPTCGPMRQGRYCGSVPHMVRTAKAVSVSLCASQPYQLQDAAPHTSRRVNPPAGRRVKLRPAGLCASGAFDFQLPLAVRAVIARPFPLRGLHHRRRASPGRHQVRPQLRARCHTSTQPGARRGRYRCVCT